VTITQLQQLAFCAAWLIPVEIISRSDRGGITAGIFWSVVWLFCGWRLYTTHRWPFRMNYVAQPVPVLEGGAKVGKLVNRIFVPESNPDFISWAEGNPQCASYRQGETLLKRIVYAGITIDVCTPGFCRDETWVRLEIRNESDKALGLGITGFGLVLKSDTNVDGALACKSLTSYGKESRAVLVDVKQYLANIRATFDPAFVPKSAEVIIQANRILASPFVFLIPFEIPQPTRAIKET